MKFKIFTVMMSVFVLVVSQGSYSQVATDRQALNDFSREKAAQFEARKAVALEYARQNDIPVIISTEDAYMELMYIDEYGQPQYYITENATSAATVSTDDVHPGGGQGFSLDGTGMTVHEWDGGAVRGTHQELTGRVTQGDGAVSTSAHATHVAGTMIASGVVSSAKGMSPNASLRAFEWNNDDAEMADEAANQNALISNHSYGYIRGWYWSGSSWTWYGNASISTQEDYLFGFYDSQARDWDQIAFNAPYYLITKSAGNDRGDGPTGGTYPKDGPYDCIGHAGNAKNVLTVGAVDDISGGWTQPSDVVMSSFSSWGPADDGRIKPDIVTNGISLYSSLNTNNTSYGSYSGTSMASPSAAGSMLLLQQHYHALNGQYMRAATLKALVIHTADEAGDTPGPDYEFGWGLMNTLSAAQKISEDQNGNVIDELVLNNGASYQRTVTSDGTTPLVVTIVWTDVPGTPVSASLDPITPMLVNDLDLRIAQNTSVFYPWKLDRNNPSAGATNSAENNVDNVETVYIASPAAGDYTITVDHDGTLSGGSQAFSIVISGIYVAPPSPPVADFTATPTSLYAGESVSFTDASTNNPTSWSWEFGDGGTSNQQNPAHTYTSAGIYSVMLTATNASGSDVETKTGYITVNPHPPIADFTNNASTVLIGGTVQFTDLSLYNPTSWSWSFPGGSPAVSNDQHPLVTYNSAGVYDVTLEVTSTAGTDSKTVYGCITVSDNLYCPSHGWAIEEWIQSLEINGTVSNSGSSGAPGYQDLTGFTFNIEAGTSLPVTLTPGFSSKNKFEYYRIWIDFNTDGDFADYGEEVFAADKQRSVVSGTIAIPAGISAETRMRVSMKRESPVASCDVFAQGEVEDYTVVIGVPTPQPPVAEFSASTTTAYVGQTVNFNDLSTNSPTSWSWSFGDGGTSTVQNPAYVYGSSGTYTVTLTATNAYGSGSVTKVDYITVSEAPPPSGYCIPLAVNSNTDHITQVIIGDVSNPSGGDGYVHYPGPLFAFAPGQTYSVALTPAVASSREFWKIWIDFNNDGDFDDSDETVLVANNKKGNYSDIISIPSYATGDTRMRITMKTGGSPTSCEDNFEGEVEDYDVTFSSAVGNAMAVTPSLHVDIYPNPVSDRLHLNIIAGREQVRVSVINLLGQEQMAITAGNGYQTLDVSGLEKGLYLVRVSDGPGFVNKTFIKR